MAANPRQETSRRKTQLGPTLLDRARALLSAGHSARMLMLRKAAATALVLLAGVLALYPRAGSAGEQVPVLVTAHELAPGHPLTRHDVVARQFPADAVPQGAFHEFGPLDGRTLIGASRSGEPLTDARLADPASSPLTVGDSSRAAVPIRLTDPGIADFLHPGQRVDIVTDVTHSSQISTLAEAATVIAIRPPEGPREQGRLIVVGLPEEQAASAAAASLNESVTVTLR